MHFSWTLWRYLATQFLFGVGIVFGATLCLILLVDIVELLRRSSAQDGVPFTMVITMALFKLPNISELALPFSFLFGAIWTFVRLNRSNELVVTRASGLSIWQFLSPPLAIAVFLGLFDIAVYNPIASALVARYEQLENKYLRGQTNVLTVSSSGLWLRQGDKNGQSVVHANHVSDGGDRLQDVFFLLYQGTDKFSGRIDAEHATLRDGYWDIRNAWFTQPGISQRPEHYKQYTLETPLTKNRIQESFASPQTISFWELPRFIRLAEAAGFSAAPHRLHWYSLMSTPLLLAAMVLVAATFSLRVYRLGGTAIYTVAGIMTGFLLYFVTNTASAFGLSGNMPLVLAAWAPTLVALLLGSTFLLHLEDG